MKWNGEKIKGLAKENKVSLASLAGLSGVTRQTVNGWIRGQIPRGNHLLSLCKIFNVTPDYFFSDDDASITVPAHRTRRKAKVTPALQKDALNLAKEYAFLFKNDLNSSIVPVVRLRDRNASIVRKIANKLRYMSGVPDEHPLDYKHTFRLLERLGIKVIFQYFPEKLKAYAFFTKIHGHRAVFVNNHTNVLDLIFPLIHEAVHAIRDEINITDVFDADEEAFCDDVANCVQFPDDYVETIYETIKDLPTIGHQVNTLKTFGKKYGHALYGIIKQIKTFDSDFNIKIGGADTNLKKKFPTIGDVLFADDDIRVFLNKMYSLSPLFMDIVSNQIDTITTRKLGELFGLERTLDANEIKKELKKMRIMID